MTEQREEETGLGINRKFLQWEEVIIGSIRIKFGLILSNFLINDLELEISSVIGNFIDNSENQGEF